MKTKLSEGKAEHDHQAFAIGIRQA